MWGEFVDVIELEYGEMLYMLSNGEALVIDVRTKKEYDRWHVKGSVNIPKEEFEEITDEDLLVAKLKNHIKNGKKIILYCKTENRSLQCMKILDKYNIVSGVLKGGISNFLPNTD